MKLTRKFTIGLVGGILVVQTAFAIVRVDRERELFRLDIAREEHVLGRSLAQNAEVVAAAGGVEVARRLVERANVRDSHVEIRWVELGEGAAADVAPRAALSALAPLRKGELVSVELGTDDPAVHTYSPVTLPDGTLAAIEIADPLQDETAYMQESVRNAVLSTAVLVLLSGVVAWTVGLFFIGRPVRALVAQARRIGRGDLSERVALRQKDELSELATEMNDMCVALEDARSRVEHETDAKFAALEQLKHVDRLRTVGTLASGIAHELGTPLNVVDGHAQLIREDTSAGDTAKEHAQIIAHQAKRMTTIIRQLLDFARRDHNPSAAALVETVVERALEMAAPLAKKRDVDLELDSDRNHRAQISEEELTQVLVNVVINGIQAMPDGGQLTVRIDALDASPEWAPGEERGMIRIMVADGGVGMSQQTRERVFEPFFTTKDVGDGTGLGLSVAFGIVQERNGWITVDSAVDEGSRFSIYVPEEKRA